MTRASDEALWWAAQLRLGGDIIARALLYSLARHADDKALCFVGIKTLAEELEKSEQTVRRRLAWLESIGAIVRRPQWLDRYGQRNTLGCGRRTTDEIELLLNRKILRLS